MRLIKLAALGLVGALALTACGDDDDTTAGSNTGGKEYTGPKVSLTLWNGFTGGDGDIFKKLVDQFNTEHANIAITVATYRWEDYYAKLPGAVSSGNGPDIAVMHMDQLATFAARKVIADAGYGPGYKYFTHRVGHGMGMDGHEWPYLVKGNTLPLAPGMTFSDEPGIYIRGEFGVRLEDDMYITADGAELMTPQSRSIEHPFATS